MEEHGPSQEEMGEGIEGKKKKERRYGPDYRFLFFFFFFFLSFSLSPLFRLLFIFIFFVFCPLLSVRNRFEVT